MADGAYRWQGNTPAPDAERTAVIRDAIDVGDPDLGQTFGERARREVLTLTERLLAETRAGDLGECAALLAHVRERLAALDPRALQTARGVAGWFDSRGRRLKRFRAEFLAVMRGVSDTVADLTDRGGGLERREAALEQLWVETRIAISELDAYIAAGQACVAEPAPIAEPEPSAWLAGNDRSETAEALAISAEVDPEPEVPTEPASTDPFDIISADGQEPASAAVAEAAPIVPPEEPEGARSMTVEPVSEPGPQMVPEIPVAVSDAGPEPDPAPTPMSPPRLEERVAALVAARETAVRQLPLVRLAQNADCRLPDRLKGTGEAVTRWRTEWSDALGLNVKRPRKIKPDQAWLTREHQTLAGAIAAMDADIAAARARRSDVEARMTRVAESVRRAT